MISLDGRSGGGGLLRTALGLAAATGRAFEAERIRAGRPEPGLKPQHRTAVETVAGICDAEADGAELGATSLTFRPGEVGGGRVDAAMGTAGSLTLLFDAVLPLAVRLDGPLVLRATGGTDVKWSPPVEYLRSVKLPLLARFGLDADVEAARTGFYPAGGGEATLRLRPSSGRPLDVVDRGSLERVDVYSTASESLESAEVADRQATRVEKRLREAGLPVDVRRRAYEPTASPGSSLLLGAVYDRTLVGVNELGERGRPSEAVADRAVDRLLRLHEAGAVVDDHMADQLLPFLGLWGGRLRMPRVTDHVEANLAVLDAFGCEVELTREGASDSGAGSEPESESEPEPVSGEGALVTASRHPALGAE
jgi:RNA 3'-terminal phosphate cyclase (ATP)